MIRKRYVRTHLVVLFAKEPKYYVYICFASCVHVCWNTQYLFDRGYIFKLFTFFVCGSMTFVASSHRSIFCFCPACVCVFFVYECSWRTQKISVIIYGQGMIYLHIFERGRKKKSAQHRGDYTTYTYVCWFHVCAISTKHERADEGKMKLHFLLWS